MRQLLEAMTSVIARLLKRDYGIPFRTRDSWFERGGKPKREAS